MNSSSGRQERARKLRDLAATLTDDDAVVTAQTIADYIESTADDLTPAAYAEIAMAYAEGLEWAFGERNRDLWRALHAAGLTR